MGGGINRVLGMSLLVNLGVDVFDQLVALFSLVCVLPTHNHFHQMYTGNLDHFVIMV